MTSHPHPRWTRRELLGRLGGASAALLGLGARTAAAEPPPETTRIRLAHDPAFPVPCWAPKVIASEFLRLEGFTDIEYVPYGEFPDDAGLLAAGAADFGADLVTGMLAPIDRGEPVVVLGGMHAGCTEIFANESVRSISALRGKRIPIYGYGGSTHVFLAAVVAHIGLDPQRDIEWVLEPEWPRWSEMLAAGEVDAVGAFPSGSYELRDAGVGHVILNTTVDTPWRHYLCCVTAGNRDFVNAHPVATKRVLRALYKASELCSAEPERAARLVVEGGGAERYDYALRALRELPYGSWRTYDPRDTMRFFSLRLREAGMVNATPQEILERGADFRFADELRRELKA